MVFSWLRRVDARGSDQDSDDDDDDDEDVQIEARANKILVFQGGKDVGIT
jgi:hypothetical protein